MTKFYNGLNKAQEERLYKLAEECGEVVQIVCKILRHGYESCHPKNLNKTNKDLLEKELGDLEAILNLMDIETDINALKISEYCQKKYKKQLKHMHYQNANN